MKKGISLIVLVITIIIMIILAGAVILSLSGSDVTGKANWSTLSSDRANYQAQYATNYANEVVSNDGVDKAYSTWDAANKITFATTTKGTWGIFSGTSGAAGTVVFKPTQADAAAFKAAYGMKTEDTVPSWVVFTGTITNGVYSAT